MRALVVEDDARLQRVLRRGLSEEGFAVDVAADGEDGLHLACTEPYDAIVLDLLLPRLSGSELLRTLRRRGHDTPVLILSARDSHCDKIEELDAGADDYMAKPFALAELSARLRALIRRTHRIASAEVMVGPLAIDTGKRRVTCGGRELALRAKEYAILELLALRRGHVVRRSEIEDHVWGHDAERLSNAVDVHVCRLRALLESACDVRLIHTRRGQGYVLDAPDASSQVT